MKRKVWELTVLDNPNRAVGGESDIFYTTDTEAFLIFRLTDADFNPTTATLTLVNTSDKSVINETVPVIDKEIEWEMTEEAIAHSGNWQAQLVYMQEKAGKAERYTSQVVQFDVQSHLMTGRQPALVAIEDWNTFMATAQELLNQIEEETGGIFIDIDELEQQYRDSEQTRVEAEDIRETNESARQAEESQRASSESTRVDNEQQRVDNESLRESSETDRVSAEQNRVTAENERNDLYDLVQQKLENGDFVGEKGDTGDGLEYVWDGTQLGLRIEGQTTYTYVNLKGDKGDTGEMENLDSSHIVDALGYMPISATDIPEPTWENVEGKPTNLETTEGSQSKADEALTSANQYTDQEVGSVADDLAAHLADDVSQREVHGLRVSNEKLEYYTGTEWKIASGGIPVGNVSGLSVEENNAEITLMWTDPDDRYLDDVKIAEWQGTKIVRKEGSYPVSDDDGTLVVDNTIKNQYSTNGYKDTGLTNEVTYYYMAFPYTEDAITVDGANRVAGTPIDVDDPSGSPGSPDLIAGTMEEGFFGEVPASELITGDVLASECGISQGTSQHSTAGWLKFAYKGDIQFVAKKPIRHSISWDAINAANCVYGDSGDKTVAIGGLTYKVRLMRALEPLNDPKTVASATSGEVNHHSEWNRLMCQIHEQAINKSWDYPDNIESDIGILEHSLGSGSQGMYSDADLLTHYDHGSGSRTWCQEMSASTSGRLHRGSYGVSYSHSYTSSTPFSSVGWRPVLKLVP